MTRAGGHLTRRLAIIAGTGFATLATLKDPVGQSVGTTYGSASVTTGTWHDLPVVFLQRHGAGHALPPHLVNYRANIAALRHLGCTDIVAVNVVGAIDDTLAPGDLVCVSDFLDFTKSREQTFFDGAGPEGVVHVDVAGAYDPALRAEILRAAQEAGEPMRDGGVYACFEGPRFESPAEIRMARVLGADLAGMTGVPEVTLAVEAGLPYAAVSLVVNPAAGLRDVPITMEEVTAVLAASSQRVVAVLDQLVQSRSAEVGAS